MVALSQGVNRRVQGGVVDGDAITFSGAYLQMGQDEPFQHLFFDNGPRGNGHLFLLQLVFDLRHRCVQFPTGDDIVVDHRHNGVQGAAGGFWTGAEGHFFGADGNG